jgi:hypothetical protein
MRGPTPFWGGDPEPHRKRVIVVLKPKHIRLSPFLKALRLDVSINLSGQSDNVPCLLSLYVLN